MPPLPLFDDHVHTTCSIDGHNTVLELGQAALEKGLAGLAITDHFDTDPADPGYGHYDFDQIARAAEQARRAFAGRLSILIGAEVCFQPVFARRIADFLQACPLDFALGSAHYVQREFVHEPYFARRTPEEAYSAYLQAVEETVASGLFDALGHLDLAKRYATPVYGPFDPQPYWAQIERILRLLIARGMALEINTSGWRQPPGEPYPGEAVLRRYAELGGMRITIGADSHRAEQVGFAVERACLLVRRLGFTHLTRYVRRQPQLIPL